jgi:outer membrane protein assembly factor BamB
VVKDNIAYVGCLDHRVYAIETSTGNELWRFEGDSSFVAPPVLVGNSLVICSESGSLYILDAAKGTMVKTVSIDSKVMAPIYADGNNVYIHARDRNVYCIDLQDGQIAWKFSSVIVNK